MADLDRSFASRSYVVQDRAGPCSEHCSGCFPDAVEDAAGRILRLESDVADGPISNGSVEGTAKVQRSSRICKEKGFTAYKANGYMHYEVRKAACVEIWYERIALRIWLAERDG